jgi:hypothetical protein
MPIEAEFQEMFPQQITVKKTTGVRNIYGVSALTIAATFDVRWVKKNRLVRATSGREEVSSSHVWIYGLAGIAPEDEVTLPDGTKPPVLSVEQYPDQDGMHHEKVFFGSGGAGRSV